MLLLWIMVGLTVVALLILNIFLIKRHRAERRRRELADTTEREEAFQINCRKYNLSAREMEVLRLVLDGLTYAEAADTLFIAKKTVDTHMQNIYDKVGVRSRYALVYLFYAV